MSFRAIKLLRIVGVVLAVSCDAWASLPRCHEEATALPDGWQQVVAPAQDITFALPPEFVWSEKQPAFIHGGGLWTGSGIEVTITYGYWGMSSFDMDDADRVCQTQINSLPVILIVNSRGDRNSMTAWIQTKAQPYEPVLTVSFVDWDDIAVARHIIGSAERLTGE